VRGLVRVVSWPMRVLWPLIRLIGHFEKKEKEKKEEMEKRKKRN